MSSETTLPPNKTIIEFSASTLNNFQKCERYYKYSVVDKLEPHLKNEKLDKGSLMHIILEQYYREILAGKARQPAHLEAIEKGRDEAPKTDLELPVIEEVISTFRRYHVKYQNDNWQPLGIEEPFAKVIHEDENLIIIIRGKIDLRLEIPPHPGVKIVDHKTGDSNYAPISLSNQFEMYCLATGGREVIKNFLGFQKDPDLNFSRKPFAYSSEYLEEQRQMLIYWGIQMYQTEVANFFPLRKNNCFKCEFADVCATPPSGRDFKLKVNYKTREKYDLFAQKDSGR